MKNDINPDNDPAEFRSGVIALDLATIGWALRHFVDSIGVSWEDIKPTEAGRPLLDKLSLYGAEDYDIRDICAEIQPEAGREKLNDFTEEHGFGRVFTLPFQNDEVGLVSIVDKKMFWHEGDAVESSFPRKSENKSFPKFFKAVRFSLTSDNEAHFSSYRLPGFAKPVVRVAADPDKSAGVENYMWATELPPDARPSFNALFATVQQTVITVSSDPNTKRESSETIASITMPQLNKVEYARTLDELIGMKISPSNIRHARQKVRVSIDEIGAKAAALTDMLVFRATEPVDTREHITLGDLGFLLVWFTEGKSNLPICIMLTTPEAWTKS